MYQSYLQSATAQMSKKFVRGEPEAIFSFNDDKEIKFEIETETIKDWKIITYTSPCNVCHYGVV